MFTPTVLNRRFARHYGEMVLAMFAGMVVLGVPVGWLLDAFGSSWGALHEDAPAAMLGLMAIMMTAPMSAWMYRMGHGLRANLEMAGSMIVPTIGVIGLLAAGLVVDAGDLMLIQHVVMLAAMFAVMALRPEHYSGLHVHATIT